MPPVGIEVSLNTKILKLLPKKAVTPSSEQNPGMTVDSAEAIASCFYTDDANIYVRNLRAGTRVMSVLSVS